MPSIMKQIFFLLALFTSLTVHCQDVIVKKDGGTIVSKVLEVNTADIKYKKFSNQNGPTYSINKNEIISINYENGEKDVFNNSDNRHISNDGIAVNANEDQDANFKALQSMSNIDVRYIGKPSNEKANMLIGIFKPTHDAVMVDKNIELIFKTKPNNYYSNSPCPENILFSVIIKNRTNKTLFLDLANTFFVHGLQASPYYQPTIKSETEGHNSGVGVNMGAVAGAMGVAGAIGTLASGISVGGGTSHSTTTTTISQRIISIPPMSAQTLDNVCLFPHNNITISDKYFYKKTSGGQVQLQTTLPQSNMLKIGEKCEYEENNDFGRFGVVVTYSNDEKVSNPYTLQSFFFLQQFIGTKAKNALGFKTFNVETVSSDYLNTLHFFVIPQKK